MRNVVFLEVYSSISWVLLLEGRYDNQFGSSRRQESKQILARNRVAVNLVLTCAIGGSTC